MDLSRLILEKVELHRSRDLLKGAVERLAREFSDGIRSILSPEEMADVVEKNRATGPGGPCATHDHVDANVVMLVAFKKVFGRDSWGPQDVEDGSATGEQEDADLRLVNGAWDLARKNDFYTKGGGQ